jgi:site-specific DNA recombinase
MKKALAIGRVSTKNQADNNHSLDAQRTSVDKMAEELGVEITHRWEMAISSRRGKNLKRIDLKEAKAMCKRDKDIAYILLDRVNRLGREAKYLTFYMLELEFDHEVQLIFCDSSQQQLNGTDPKTFLKRVEKLVDAEEENEERIQTSTSKMQSRVALGYYPFYPHQGYKKTSAADGLHIPDEPRFSLLQQALRCIADYSMTPKEALEWLAANGYTTPKGSRKLDMNHFQKNILEKPYYAGRLEIAGWPINEHGMHRAMITLDEHKAIIEIINKRKVRKKKKFNPDFPLNLALHKPCVHAGGKLTGINHTNGKGWWRKEYVCRICKKRVSQSAVHQSLSNLLNSVGLTKEARDELKQALNSAWNRNEDYRIERLKQLNKNKEALNQKKGQLINSMTENSDLAEDFKEEIIRVKSSIAALDQEIVQAGKVDEDLGDFINYALDYTENLRSKWWTLSPESMTECKKLLFNNDILVDEFGKVYTPTLSRIYSLQKAKSGPKTASNAELEELAGTAPASVSLSWLVVYRHSPFKVSWK